MSPYMPHRPPPGTTIYDLARSRLPTLSAVLAARGPEAMRRLNPGAAVRPYLYEPLIRDDAELWEAYQADTAALGGTFSDGGRPAQAVRWGDHPADTGGGAKEPGRIYPSSGGADTASDPIPLKGLLLAGAAALLFLRRGR